MKDRKHKIYLIDENKPKGFKDFFSREFVSNQTVPPDPDKGKNDFGQKTEQGQGISKIKFDMLPEELENYLNQYVIKQDDAKEVLSTKICTHFHRIKTDTLKKYPGSIKGNILMLGPTGIGKTYLIRLIADKLGVPFVKSDATKFSETGYVGRDVEDLIRELVHEADGDIELAEHGIIYIDEIDKIASVGNTYGPDVSRTGVQRNLLKLMEETEVDLKSPADLTSQMEMALKFQKTGKIDRKKVNTRNILFIMSGAFIGIKEIVEKRLNKQKIGFSAQVSSSGDTNISTEIVKQVKSEDLITFGFESEFIGRLPVVVVLDILEVEDLYKILGNPTCPIVKSKIQDFRSYGIDIRFTDESFYKIAEKAYEERTGARALLSILEKTLLKFEKKLPSLQLTKLVVTDKIVTNPEEELGKLLNGSINEEQEKLYNAFVEQDKERIKKGIIDFQNEFQKKYNKKIHFTDIITDFIIEKVLIKGNNLKKTCAEIIQTREQIFKFENSFYERYGMHVHFDEDAVYLIIKKSMKERKNVEFECQEILKNYELGLKLIQSRTGKNDFTITKEVVESPESYLNNLIKTSFNDNENSPEVYKI